MPKIRVYAVRIKMRAGQKHYVTAANSTLHHEGIPRLTRDRARAAKFLERGIAEFVSEAFWKEYWNRETMECREVVTYEMDIV